MMIHRETKFGTKSEQLIHLLKSIDTKLDHIGRSLKTIDLNAFEDHKDDCIIPTGVDHGKDCIESEEESHCEAKKSDWKGTNLENADF